MVGSTEEPTRLVAVAPRQSVFMNTRAGGEYQASPFSEPYLADMIK